MGLCIFAETHFLRLPAAGSDRLRLGKHQLCARFGAELDLARVAVEARGLVSLELDALVADDDVNLAHAAVDERHALAAVDGLVLARRKVLAAHLALALALAEHEVEVAAAAPGMGVVAAVEAVEITDLLASLNGRPFFLSYLYAVMRAANAVPELRRRLLPDGQVVEYDHCDPSYTVMKPDGTGVYVYCLLEDDLSSYEKFVAEGKRRQKETLERGTLTEDGDVLANFFVSCVPWLYYTQIKEPAGGADDSNPRFAWGKYREENGRMMLPMSLFINHALCDGWHVTQFYKNLDRELAELSAYLKTQNEQQ